MNNLFEILKNPVMINAEERKARKPVFFFWSKTHLGLRWELCLVTQQ